MTSGVIAGSDARAVPPALAGGSIPLRAVRRILGTVGLIPAYQRQPRSRKGDAGNPSRPSGYDKQSVPYRPPHSGSE